ncbi:MAG TPA: T9SS type A sorting domain-containing protein [Bacteroidia bacterium]|nr:T9SS type A sorting domain-containing protein [Bacteroidia bacterium]
MQRSLLLFFVFILGLSDIFSQQLPEQWVRSYQAQGKAADRISAISTDASGNVYVAGYAGNHHGSPDAFAMKRNIQGDTLWVYYYDGGGNNEDYATDIALDNSGNCYITGHSRATSTSLEECFTAKILPSGTEAWAARYSPGGNIESFGNAISVDVSGNVYVAGYSEPSSASTDWLVIKYNSAGAEQWVDVFNGPDNGGDEAIDIVIAPNGNPTVCGYIYTLNVTGGINAFVKEYNPAGGTVWTDTWSNTSIIGSDKAYGLAYSSSGDLFVGGESTNIIGSNKDAFAMRYDASGNRLWSGIFPDSSGTIDEYLRQVIVDSSGNVYFTGSNYIDAYVTRINNDGTPGWRKFWRGPLANGNDVFHGITIDNSGNVYATGRAVYPGVDHYANGGKANMVIAKYSPAGDSLWTYRCLDTLNSSMGFSVAYHDGKIYAGGFTTDTAYVNENLYTIIIDTSGNPVNEWIYNGIGDAITMGQFVQTDVNDNVYCAATIDRLYANGTDIAIVKYDPFGTLLWQRYFSSYGWNNDTLTSMQFDPLGNLVISFSSDSALTKNNYHLGFLKIDQNGNFIDTSWYNNTSTGSILANSMDIRFDGSIALTVNSNILGGLIIYFDNSMNAVWQSKIDSTQFAITRANSVYFYPNGDLLVAGYSQVGGMSAGVVQSYDETGNLLWSTLIDSIGTSDEVRDAVVNSLGEVFYTGSSGGASSYTTIVGKLDGSTGAPIWQTVYNPSTGREYGVKVRFTPAGNVVLISRGWTGSVARYYTAQYSGSGMFQWATVYSQTASDREPIDLLVEPNNRVVTAGWAINGFSTNYDYVLAGYDETGATEFVNTYTDTTLVSSSWDQLRDLTRDSQGNFIVTGQSSQEFYNNFLYKMVTIKYGGVVVSNNVLSLHEKYSAFAYPNPSFNGLFTLVDSSPFKLQSIIIYDTQGRFINEINLSANIIDLRNSSKGMYIVVLKRENHQSDYLRLIVN